MIDTNAVAQAADAIYSIANGFGGDTNAVKAIAKAVTEQAPPNWTNVIIAAATIVLGIERFIGWAGRYYQSRKAGGTVVAGIKANVFGTNGPTPPPAAGQEPPKAP